jgi:hypothetical protein
MHAYLRLTRDCLSLQAADSDASAQASVCTRGDSDTLAVAGDPGLAMTLPGDSGTGARETAAIASQQSSWSGVSTMEVRSDASELTPTVYGL